MTHLREVRRARTEDLPALAEVFWRGVHEGAAPKYSAAQRTAWLPHRPDPAAWADRLSPQEVFVCQDGPTITGFMTLDATGYLDLAYVLPEARGAGVADILLMMVENHARAAGITRLTTRASDMARSFFARTGWTVVGPAPQVRDGVALSATDMARDLIPARQTSASAA